MITSIACTALQRLAVGLVLAIAVTTQAMAADVVRVPGTRAALAPPDGFTASQRFPGFERAQSQASIVVQEIPAPAGELMKEMNKDALASKGMNLLSSSTVKVDGRDALLLEIEQSAAGTAYRKWMLVTGDASASVLVVGTFPQSAQADLSKPVRAAVLSTTLAQAASGDPLEGLPFRVDAGKGLKLAGRVSNMLLFNESGGRQGTDPREALYVIGPSVGAPPASDLKAFSEQRARQTVQVRDLRIVSGKKVTVDGLAGYELLADGADRETGAPMRLYQVIATDPGGYYIMQGLSGRDRTDTFVPQFRAMTQSLKRTKK